MGCASGGERAAGSALRKYGGLDRLPFLWRQKEKSKTAFTGKVPRLVTVDCCSDMVLATPWVQLLPWSWTGGRLAYKGSYSAIADVLTPCCCLSPGSVKGGILLLPQCTAVHTRAHVLYLA